MHSSRRRIETCDLEPSLYPISIRRSGNPYGQRPSRQNRSQSQVPGRVLALQRRQLFELVTWLLAGACATAALVFNLNQLFN